MTLDREHSAAVPYDSASIDELDETGRVESAQRHERAGDLTGARSTNWPATVLAWLSALPSVAVAGWLLVALPLVLMHSYRPAPAIVCGLVMAAIIGRPAARVAQARARAFGDVSWWVVAAVIAVVVGFAVLAFVTSANDVIVRRDPGSYSMSATWLAAHGTIVMPTHAASFGGTDPDLSLVSQGFYLQGSHIVPQFMTGVPVLMAIGGWINGVSGVLHANAFIGAFALLAFAGLVARLVGPKWAPVAVLTLALVQPELDVMRATYSEPAAQLILLGGLCVVLDALLVGKIRPIEAPDPRRIGADERVASDARSQRLCRQGLLVGGFVLGMVLVVRIDAVADLLPLVFFVGWLAFHRQRVWRQLVVGVGLGLLVGLFDCLFLTLPYVKYVGGSLLQAAAGFVVLIPATVLVVRAAWASRRPKEHAPTPLPELLLGLGVAIAIVVGILVPVNKTFWHVVAGLAIAGIAFFFWAVTRLTWWAQAHPQRVRSARWPAVTAIGIFAGGLFYFLRPHLMTMRSGITSGGAAYVAQVQRINGLPSDPTRSYYENATRWLSWYFGWTALALALAGAMWLGYEMVRGRRREWMPVLFTILGMSAAVLAVPSITPDHPWADRRFVPIVLPGVVLLAGFFASEVSKRLAEGQWRFQQHWRAETVSAARTVVVVAAAAVLVVPAWWGSKGVFTAQTEKGEVALVNQVCAQLRPDDAVVALGAAGSSVWPGSVRIMCGVGVGYLKGLDNAAALQRIGQRVAARGGRVMVLVDGTVSGDRAQVPATVDWGPKPVAVLNTTELGHTLLKRPDHVTKGLVFEVWLGQLEVGR